MRYLILFSLVFAAGQVLAAPLTLLKCGTSFGPDQEVRVEQNDDQLTLIELTDTGHTVSRELSQAEWATRTLHLRDENGLQTRLTLTGRHSAQLHVTDGGGYNEYGAADYCE